MKRLASLLLMLLLLLTAPALASSKKAPVYPDAVQSHVGRSFVYTPSERRGVWQSSDEQVARVDSRGRITFFAEGDAVITFTENKGGKVFELHVNAQPAGEMPQAISDAVALSLQEWEENLGTSIPKSNKYTYWYCGRKCEFGWCGGFVNYVLDTAGVPMQKREESVLQEGGHPYAVREAAVPKILEGFTKMDRLTMIPQPGYEVIYGRRGGYATIHVGFVSAVTPLGEGKYLVETVEGNMGPRIRRFSYVYDAWAENVEKNMSPLPKEQQTQPDVFTYQPHLEGTWYINWFGQTWY